MGARRAGGGAAGGGEQKTAPARLSKATPPSSIGSLAMRCCTLTPRCSNHSIVSCPQPPLVFSSTGEAKSAARVSAIHDREGGDAVRSHPVAGVSDGALHTPAGTGPGRKAHRAGDRQRRLSEHLSTAERQERRR